MKLLGKLICFITRKHRRGQLLQTMGKLVGDAYITHARYFCSRCGAQWVRRILTKKAKPTERVIPESLRKKDDANQTRYEGQA